MNDEPINPETLAAAERWAGSNRRHEQILKEIEDEIKAINEEIERL